METRENANGSEIVSDGYSVLTFFFLSSFHFERKIIKRNFNNICIKFGLKWKLERSRWVV